MPRSRSVVPAVALAVFFLAVGGLAAYRVWLMIPEALDLGFFTSAIRALGTSGFEAEVEWVSSPVLGDHFSPMMLVLFPLSALELFPVWLVVVQALSISVAVWILWRFTSARTDVSSAALITAGAALHPATLYSAFVDVHMNVFGLPLVVGTLASVAARRGKLAATLGVAACFVREDLAAVVLLLAVFNWRALGKWPSSLMVASSTASLVLWRIYSVDLGADRLFGFVDTADPLATTATALGHLVDPLTVLTVALLALPWIVFRNVAWKICLPVIAVHAPLLFAEWGYARTISHHYYVAIPFAFAIAVASSERWVGLDTERRRLGIALVVLLAVVGPFGANAVTAPNIHESVLSYLGSYDKRIPVASSAREAVRCVDVSTSVAASSNIVPWLARQEQVFHLPSPIQDFAVGSGESRVTFSEASDFRPDAIISIDPSLPLAEGYFEDEENPLLFWSEPGRSCVGT